MEESEWIDRLARAIDQAGNAISGIRPQQATLPTPCRSWDVRELVNHLVHDLQQFTAMAAGGRYEKDESDVIGEDWLGAIHLPFGDVPATWSVGQQVADIVVHGWDIAKATGQPTELDPDLGRVSLEWGRENLKPQFRGDEDSGKVFGPEVAVPEDATVYEQLAGWFGRDPRWSG
ncbi:MAG: hypothetical protein E6G44_08465 [Actinobacteria bacterium]|nr:MAG: hypothetical protein E6G44_08465 [Actinomycetota bacterium]